MAQLPYQAVQGQHLSQVMLHNDNKMEEHFHSCYANYCPWNLALNAQTTNAVTTEIDCLKTSLPKTKYMVHNYGSYLNYLTSLQKSLGTMILRILEIRMKNTLSTAALSFLTSFC